MSDTQWPRFQVFVQERAGLPFEDAGSVHASDSELALQNARDVFARRPECAAMWVIPVEAIFSRTAEEIHLHGIEPVVEAPLGGKTYHVFCKSRSAGTQTQVGAVESASPEGALKAALAKFSGKTTPFAWWVFPASAVTQSDPRDAGSLYAPAHDKGFRMSTDFHTHSVMREVMKK